MKGKKYIAILLLLGIAITGLSIAQDAQERIKVISLYADVPIGSILIYNGVELDFNSYGYLKNDTRFHICNGNNNTVDLRDRFIVGSGGDYPVLSKGGLNSVTLKLNEIPSHNHKYFLNQLSVSTATYGITTGTQRVVTGVSYSIHVLERYTDFSGSSESHENRPPYVALYYIQRME